MSSVREVPAKTDPALPGALALSANDASNFRQVPIGVVVPKTLDEGGRRRAARRHNARRRDRRRCAATGRSRAARLTGLPQRSFDALVHYRTPKRQTIF